jgi:plasmid stabilization system protein ParE
MVITKEKTSGHYSLRISVNALQNIREITGYIAFVKHQPINAIKVGDKIFETFDRIQLNPFSFRECGEIQTETKLYRKAVCMSWLIIYKVSGSEILNSWDYSCQSKKFADSQSKKGTIIKPIL